MSSSQQARNRKLAQENEDLWSKLDRLRDDDFRTRIELQQVTAYLCEAVQCLREVTYKNRGDALRIASLLDRISYAVDAAGRGEDIG